MGTSSRHGPHQLANAFTSAPLPPRRFKCARNSPSSTGFTSSMPGAAALADGATSTTALGAALATVGALATIVALDVVEGSRIAFDLDLPQASGISPSNATNRESVCLIDPDERARRLPRLRS